MKARKIIFFCALFLAPLCTGLACQNFSPRMEADSRLDKSIFEEPQFSAKKLERASLVASGADEEKTGRLLNAFDDYWKELSGRLLDSDSEEEKADKILLFIYEKLLSKYSFNQTLVDEALETGVYNCVSSAIIFLAFAKRAGLPVAAVETPRHAFCVLLLPQGNIDVETTNPYGVNPGKKRAQTVGKGRTQYITVPAKNYSGRRQVDDRRLVGLVYTNRISQLQKKKRNDETVGLAVDAYFVQGRTDVSRADLELCAGNAAGDLSRAGKDQEAIDFLTEMEGRFGKSQNWTKRIFNSYHNLVLAKIKALPYAEGLAAADQYKQNLREKDFFELKEFAYLQAAQKAAQNREWKAAIEISGDGLSEFPQSKKLSSNKNVYAHNYAIDFHNAAVGLFNKGRTQEALQKVEEGLTEIPGNKILLGDLNSMSK